MRRVRRRRRALARNVVRQAYRNLGHEAFATTPEQLAALVKSDSQKYARVIRETNVKPE